MNKSMLLLVTVIAVFGVPSSAQAAINCNEMSFSGRPGLVALSATCAGATKAKFEVSAGGVTTAWRPARRAGGGSFTLLISSPSRLVLGTREWMRFTVSACKGSSCVRFRTVCRNSRCGKITRVKVTSARR